MPPNPPSPALGVVVLTTIALLVGWFHGYWLCDDAFISFRVVEQVVAGHGLVWNAGERVQAFTNPLWVLLLVPWRALGLALPWVALGWSLVLTLLTWGLVFGRLLRDVSWQVQLGTAALLLSSRAFLDFSSSGLENPLTHALLGGLLVVTWSTDGDVLRRAGWVALMASLALVDRLDTVALTAPVVAVCGAQAARQVGVWAVARRMGAAASPAWAWLAFATVYYGSPVPNTARAKLPVDVSGAWLRDSGVDYLRYTVTHDPVTAVLIVGGSLAVLVRCRRGVALAWVAGLVLSLVYVVQVGGDYMAGRFVAAQALVGAALLARSLPGRWGAGLMVALALAAQVLPGATVSYLVPAWGPMPRDGIVRDERGASNRAPAHLSGQAHGEELSEDPVQVMKTVGEVPWLLGVDVHVVDTLGLTEPLLSRLPTRRHAVGHHERVVPLGYVASLTTGRNALEDPALRAFYHDVRQVTRGPLWSTQRWAAVWRLTRAPWFRGVDGEAHDLSVVHMAGDQPQAMCRGVDAAVLGRPKADGHPADQLDVLHLVGCGAQVTGLAGRGRIEASLSGGSWTWLVVVDDVVVEHGLVEVPGDAGVLRVVTLPVGEASQVGLRPDRAGGIGHIRRAP